MPDIQNIINKQTKDILYRNIIVAFLDILNKRITIEQVENGEQVSYPVNFFYNFGNDENFMKDFFIELPNDCRIPQHAEGNFEIYPKGIVTLSGIKIKAAEITNKFVRANLKLTEFNENDEKILKAYSAYLFALPIQLDFKIVVYTKTMNSILQIVESITEELYKQYVFYIQYKGIRVPAQFEIPDSGNIEKTYQFDYTQDQGTSFSFDVSIESYHPIFDEETMRYKGNRILQFISSLNTTDETLTTSVITPDSNIP